MENPIQFESVWSMFLYMASVFGFVIGITAGGFYSLYLLFRLFEVIGDYRYKRKYRDHIIHHSWEGLIEELKRRTSDPKYHMRGIYLEKIERIDEDIWIPKRPKP
jgi:hypothetical protein